VNVVKEQNILCGVSPPRDEVLLFRQKNSKALLPVRGTTGNWSTAPNQDGSETRCAQTVFAKEVGFGVVAQPRTMQCNTKTDRKNINKW
jgi:hypothetical protein